jgi:CheY-like chemotaxis protein/anti-sigma regulatory factor (Ser/Thr protein kinase)
VIERALELTQPALARRSRGIDLHLPPHPVWVTGEGVRLAQVLFNLLANAAKFTPPDEAIALVLRADSAGVEVAVEDRGSGISAELLPHVFDLFTQGEQGMDRHSGGLGLGLAIVKTLVQMHGGTVIAHSDGPGRGSTFTVRLPVVEASARKPSGGAAPRHRRTAARPYRILVVDDNEDALALLGEALAAAGHDVRTASDATRALELARQWQPELAILDIGLPEVDGYELASRIRSELSGAAPRLFALTGYGQQNDRARIREAGFDAHFVKPVEVQRLLDRMATDASA